MCWGYAVIDGTRQRVRIESNLLMPKNKEQEGYTEVLPKPIFLNHA